MLFCTMCSLEEYISGNFCSGVIAIFPFDLGWHQLSCLNKIFLKTEKLIIYYNT